MVKILIKILIFLALVIGVLLLCRISFDYLAEIALVDYITYSGIVVLAIAAFAHDGNLPANQHFLSMMVHRELVSRTDDERDGVNRVSFSISLGIVGIILLITSGVMAWLG